MRLIDADALTEMTDDRYSLGEIGRREHDDIVVEGINIYCPNCGYKTTIIGTVYKPERRTDETD